MPDLPPNVLEDRRKDPGSRHVHDQIESAFAGIRKHIDEQIELLSESLTQRLEHHVSYKALFLAMLGTVVAVFVGAWTFVARVDDKIAMGVSTGLAPIKADVQKIDSAQADYGADVRSLWRLFGEKESLAVVKRLRIQEREDNRPPPTPVNPLAPTGAKP